MVLRQTLSWESIAAELLKLRALARAEIAIHGKASAETLALIDGAILRADSALKASDFLQRIAAKV